MDIINKYFSQDILQIDDNNVVIKMNDYICKFSISNHDNNKIMINMNQNNFNDHISRICKIDSNSYYSLEQFEKIIKKMMVISNNIFKYCTICGKYSQYLLDKISYCNDNCKTKFYQTCTDDIVVNSYCGDKIVFKFLYYTTVKSLISKKIILPFNISNIIDKIDTADNYDNIFRIIELVNDDRELIKKTSVIKYGMLKYMILNNTFKLKTIPMNDNIDDEINLDRDTVCFEIIHDVIDDKFKYLDKPTYLYHGSHIYNWGSIMKNGLKNYSGTKNMVNGAAYGNGIYFSDEITMSASYSRNSTSISNIYVIGVAQVYNKEKYMKTYNIYVVNNEDDVLLKYLICYPKSSKNNLNKINDFILRREREIINSNNNMIILLTNRVNKDIEIINKNKKNYKIINQQYLNREIILDILFSIRNNQQITISVIFDISYPIYPPFLMIKSPIINIDENKYIFNNGVIIHRNITPKHWNPKKKLYKVLNRIEYILNKYNCSIKSTSKYDRNEVIKSYNKLLKLNSLI